MVTGWKERLAYGAGEIAEHHEVIHLQEVPTGNLDDVGNLRFPGRGGHTLREFQIANSKCGFAESGKRNNFPDSYCCHLHSVQRRALVAKQRLKSVSRRSADGAHLSRLTIFSALAILVTLIFSKFFYLANINSYYTFYLIDRFHLSIQQAQLLLFLLLRKGNRMVSQSRINTGAE